MDGVNQNYDVKKEEYLNKLKEPLNVLIIESIRQRDLGEKIAKILVDPKDELELQYANSYLQYYEDVILIKNTGDISLEDNLFLEFTCKYMKKAMEGGSVEELRKIVDLYEFSNYTNLAKVTYDTMIALSQKNIYNIIVSECNIDLSDQEKVAKLMELLHKAKLIIDPNDIYLNTTREGMSNFIKFVDIFHEYVNEQLKKMNSQKK